MARPVLTNFEKYIRRLDKDQLKIVITAACRNDSDICMFKSKIDDSLVVCEFNDLRCDICPYEYENECLNKMIDQLMGVDDIC